MHQQLFSKIAIGSHLLKNRLVLQQFTTGYAAENKISDRLIAYYAERARGGVGLIELELALLGALATAEQFSIKCSNLNYKWRELVDAVHVYGAKIVATLKYPFTASIDNAKKIINEFVAIVAKMESVGLDGMLLEGDRSWDISGGDQCTSDQGNNSGSAASFATQFDVGKIV